MDGDLADGDVAGGDLVNGDAVDGLMQRAGCRGKKDSSNVLARAVE